MACACVQVSCQQVFLSHVYTWVKRETYIFLVRYYRQAQVQATIGLGHWTVCGCNRNNKHGESKQSKREANLLFAPMQCLAARHTSVTQLGVYVPCVTACSIRRVESQGGSKKERV